MAFQIRELKIIFILTLKQDFLCWKLIMRSPREILDFKQSLLFHSRLSVQKLTKDIFTKTPSSIKNTVHKVRKSLVIFGCTKYRHRFNFSTWLFTCNFPCDEQKNDYQIFFFQLHNSHLQKPKAAKRLRHHHY